MRRWACLGTATALACLSCGESADSNGDGGTGGAPPSCFDLVLTPAVLGEPGRWHWVSDALPAALFSSPGGLSVAWVAYRFQPEGKTGKYTSEATEQLVLTTVAPDGAVSHETYALLPDSALFPEGEISSVAASPDGTLAVGYGFREAGIWRQEVALLRAGEGEPFARVKLPTASAADDVGFQTHAAWDGEAFAMHAYGIPPQFSLFVARVSAEGELLLPFTRYGETVNVGYGPLGHKTATSPESGRTFVFDDFALLSGHLRDGARIPGTDGGPKAIVAANVTWPPSEALAVAAHAAGGWASWFVSPGALSPFVPVQPLDLDGNPAGPALVIPAKPNPTESVMGMALLPLGDALTVFMATQVDIHRFDFDGSGVGKPVGLLGGADQGDIDIRQMAAVRWNGEIWLAYHQASYAIHVRLVKATPGCVYVAKPPGLPDGT